MEKLAYVDTIVELDSESQTKFERMIHFWSKTSPKKSLLSDKTLNAKIIWTVFGC